MKTIPSYILEDWALQTNNNNHTGVRIEIANYFGFGTFANIYKAIKERQEETGYLEPHLNKVRYYTDALLLNQIKADFGEKILSKVNKCL